MAKRIQKSNYEAMKETARKEDTVHQSLGEKYIVEGFTKICRMNGIEIPGIPPTFE